MKNTLQKIRRWYSGLPDKKRHIELITAALSIPMMTTVILVNVNNIKTQKEKALAPTVAPIQVIVDTPTNGNQVVATIGTSSANIATSSAATPSKPECKKDIGPIEILSPQEGEIISSDKACITISTDNKYCPVVWSYRLGTDNWSDFNNNDICLYNLTSGKKQLQIKVKSTAVDKTITLERNFIYQTSTAITPTSVATPSATTP